MHDPRSRVVRAKADSNIVTRDTNVDHVALDGVHIIVCVASSATDDVECMTVKVERVLYGKRIDSQSCACRDKRIKQLTPPPAAPPGMDTSTVFPGSRT